MLTLTPQARALAAFALAVLLVQGSLLRSASAVIDLFGDTFPQDRWGVLLAGLIGIAIDVAIFLLARSAARPDGGWESHLAQAALVLALVGLVMEVLAIISGLAYPGELGRTFGFFPGVASLVG